MKSNLIFTDRDDFMPVAVTLDCAPEEDHTGLVVIDPTGGRWSIGWTADRGGLCVSLRHDKAAHDECLSIRPHASNTITLCSPLRPGRKAAP